ncbi:FAD-dependent oxidoreductase [Neobacillus sp. OS1-2]|uniref:FAD-dependent oxidoreductase n=1 Tax=Neobacillus sp. OS1-2 TaxID=3070680 RepID=UPI0027DEEE2E|nr:FAD-dependent oxidoreductase [Neobacillus sp. OS1-2]WML41234.1 FAD-dependent oxidoreductase [Neobacillus sp. OS1-2]
MPNQNEYDVVIIGGGFYGCSLALQMKNYFSKVVVLEKETDLMQRASLINQARVHNGYHYPRNIITAYRSFINFPRFIEEFKSCIVNDFTKLYVIANGSKVNAFQFNEMYQGIGAPIEIAEQKYQKLFNKELVEEVFLVKEFAFDAVVLKKIMKQRLEDAGIPVFYNSEVTRVNKHDSTDLIQIELKESEQIQAKFVFNCTYSQINKLLKDSNLPLLPMKEELTEMALIQMPKELEGVGITVMDGPFFSTMPYPSKNLHTLSHVRYTPHFSWIDRESFMDGHNYLSEHKIHSNYLYMLKDAQRFIPAIKEAKYIESIYEIKTVLLQNEEDDGRPILYRKNYGFEGFYNIMGGKIDNIYDILESIQEDRAILTKKEFAGWSGR